MWDDAISEIMDPEFSTALDEKACKQVFQKEFETIRHLKTARIGPQKQAAVSG